MAAEREKRSFQGRFRPRTSSFRLIPVTPGARELCSPDVRVENRGSASTTHRARTISCSKRRKRRRRRESPPPKKQQQRSPRRLSSTRTPAPPTSRCRSRRARARRASRGLGGAFLEGFGKEKAFLCFLSFHSEESNNVCEWRACHFSAFFSLSLRKHLKSGERRARTFTRRFPSLSGCGVEVQPYSSRCFCSSRALRLERSRTGEEREPGKAQAQASERAAIAPPPMPRLLLRPPLLLCLGTRSTTAPTPCSISTRRRRSRRHIGSGKTDVNSRERERERRVEEGKMFQAPLASTV